MTRDRTVDDRISEWLLEEAPDQLPDRVLEATFTRTRASRQRRTLPEWRTPSTLRLTPARVLVGAAAIVVLAVGATLIPRSSPSVGGEPSPSLGDGSTPSTIPSASPGRTLVPVTLTGQVAFQRTVEGRTGIDLMNLDRSGFVRLTADPSADIDPSWSSDGRRIVFTRGSDPVRDVYVMNADGTDVTQLTTSPEAEDGPVFSPDGSEIAFVRSADETDFDLYVMAAEGSSERHVLRLDVAFACCPVWSIDGLALLFNQDESTSGGELDIVRVDLATGNLTRLTDYAGDDSAFALSPDGSTIAFQSDRALGGLFLMNADGSNVRHVVGAWTRESPVTWSPDGGALVYLNPDDGWLYLVDIDGTNRIRWTQGAAPAWRPTP